MLSASISMMATTLFVLFHPWTVKAVLVFSDAVSGLNTFQIAICYLFS
jgi:hypothetical protein